MLPRKMPRAMLMVVLLAAPPPPAPTGPKYRHPLTQQTWDGLGLQPSWLKDALTREGYTVDELRVLPDAHA